MKQQRQRAILEIIRSKSIYTQEELTSELAAAGYSVAQATVSRDIRELGLLKKNTKRGQKYVAAADAEVSDNPLVRVFRDGLLSVDSAENMLVLKTLPGMAMAVAAALDSMEIEGILGSVAGDDVIICVVKNKATAAALAERLI